MSGSLKKRWAHQACSWIPLDLWHRLLEVDLVLPYYHMVSDEEVPHVSALYKFRSLRQFKMDLEFFLRFYVPVTLEDVIFHLDGTKQLPNRCFLLTFDDGFRETHDVIAPILYAQGIPAAFFVITSAIDNLDLCYPQKKSLVLRALAAPGKKPAKGNVFELLASAGVEGPDLTSRIRNINYHQREVLDQLGYVLECNFRAYAASIQPYLTSDQTRSLVRQGFAVGAHSVDHPLFSALSLEEQLTQTRESLAYLSNCCRCKCQSFAFPYRDTAVGPDFFQRAFADGCLKVSFGTGGLARHFFARNLERFTMEKTDLPARQIVARQFGRAALERQLRGAPGLRVTSSKFEETSFLGGGVAV